MVILRHRQVEAKAKSLKFIQAQFQLLERLRGKKKWNFPFLLYFPELVTRSLSKLLIHLYLFST